MNDYHLEAQLKVGNTEQKVFQINFFILGIFIAIISGVMISSFYSLLDYFSFDSYLLHGFVIDFCLGIIVYLCYQLKKFFKSSEFLMFNNYKYMKEYINRKYRS